MSDRESSNNWRRAIFGIFLLLSIFVLPWYLVAVLMLVSILTFSFYIEAVFAALIYEILYSRINDSIISLKVLPVCLIVFVVWELFLRSRLRLARDE